MDLEILTHLIAQHMTLAILMIAVAEVVLLVLVDKRTSAQHVRLQDVYHNITKGMNDVPDVVSTQTGIDQTNALLVFIERKLSSRSKELSWVKRNISAQLEKNAVYNTYPIESKFGIASTLVQVFPLLGILGTILALGNVTITNGSLSGKDITQAFVLAIDTTILGIFFAVIFMLWESKVAVKVNRVVQCTDRTVQVLSKALA